MAKKSATGAAATPQPRQPEATLRNQHAKARPGLHPRRAAAGPAPGRHPWSCAAAALPPGSRSLGRHGGALNHIGPILL